MSKTTAQTKTNPGSAATAAVSANNWLKKEEYLSWILLVVVLATAFVIRGNFKSIPFERDEGIYVYIGQQLLDGKIPYQDFYEQKFPGLFYFYAVMVALAEDTVEGMHQVFTYLNLFSIIAIFFAGRILFSPFAGVVAATTFAFVSLTANLSGFTVQSEHGVAFFISLGLLFYSLYYRKQKVFYIGLMGTALGLAFMTKTSGVFLVVWGGLAIISEHFLGGKRKTGALVLRLGIYSASVLAIVAFFVFLVAMQGALSDMIYWAYEIPKNYVSKIKFEDGKQYFRYMRDAIVENHKFFWVHGILAAGVLFFKNVNRNLKVTALLLGLLSFATIVPGYYFYGHYWIQLIPALSLFGAMTYWGFTTTASLRFRWKADKVQLIYFSVFAVFVLAHIHNLRSYYFHPNHERVLRSVYGNNPFPESMEIAKFINANSTAEDQIVLMGSEPQIYFYTNKKSPSRHAYFAAIVMDVPQHKEWQREWVDAVEKAKPRYIVFFNHSISLFVQPGSDDYVFKWANEYLTKNYHVVGVADMVDGMQTNYVWKDALTGYQPKGQNLIYIYERNQQ